MILSSLKIYSLRKQRQKLILDKDKQEKLEICDQGQMFYIELINDTLSGL